MHAEIEDRVEPSPVAGGRGDLRRDEREPGSEHETEPPHGSRAAGGVDGPAAHSAPQHDAGREGEPGCDGQQTRAGGPFDAPLRGGVASPPQLVRGEPDEGGGGADEHERAGATGERPLGADLRRADVRSLPGPHHGWVMVAHAHAPGPGGLGQEGEPPLVPFPAVLGEREAEVLEVTPVDIHGVSYADVTLAFSDGVVASARLGRESIPVDLAAGTRVLVQVAMNVIVGVREA